MTGADEIVFACFHGLGDVVSATSLLEPLHENWPGRPVRWVTSKALAPLFAHNPHVDAVDIIDGDASQCDAQYPALRARYGERLVTPAPYMNGPGNGRTLIGLMRSVATKIGVRNDGRTLLYVTADEEAQAWEWIARNVTNGSGFLLLEWQHGSSQSPWTSAHTAYVVQRCQAAGVSVVGASPQPQPGVIAFDGHYRLLVSLYNRARAFVGVSSGPSCIAHTHMARVDVPHAEFVYGAHWSTADWPRARKRVAFGDPMLELTRFLDEVLA